MEKPNGNHILGASHARFLLLWNGFPLPAVAPHVVAPPVPAAAHPSSLSVLPFSKNDTSSVSAC